MNACVITVRPLCEQCGKVVKLDMRTGKRFAEISDIRPSCKCEAPGGKGEVPDLYEELLAADAESSIQYGYGPGDPIYDEILSEYLESLGGQHPGMIVRGAATIRPEPGTVWNGFLFVPARRQPVTLTVAA